MKDPAVTDAVTDAVTETHTSGPTSMPSSPVSVYPLSAALVTDRGPDRTENSTRADAPLLPTTWSLPATAGTDAGLVDRLVALGLDRRLFPDGFAFDAAERGAHAALTRLLRMRLPDPPSLPSEPGSTILVLGPGLEALAAARTLATRLRIDPSRVLWAAPEDLVGLVPAAQRIRTVEEAAKKAQSAAKSATVTVVAVHAHMTIPPADWAAQVVQAWDPTAVWAVVDATRKPADAFRWVADLPRVDAVMVEHTGDSADPGTFLASPVAPVGLVDGQRATSTMWASLLCERLEERSVAA